MLIKLTSRPVLAATASVAALCVGIVIVQPGLVNRPGPVDAVPGPVPEQPVVAAPEEKPEADMTASGAALAPGDERVAPSAKVAAEAALTDPNDAAAMASGGEVAEAAPEAPAAEESAARMAEAPATVADAPMVAEPSPEMEVAQGGQSGGIKLSGYAEIGIADQSPGAEIDAQFYNDAASAPTAMMAQSPEPDTEAYANEAPNPVKIVAEEPVSTFSTDVDTTSWSVVRSSVTNGYLPPPEAVRVEEMVNYFPYSYPAPEADGAPFRTSVSLFQTPWNKDTQLLRIGLQGRLPAVEDRPALDLVFLIDTSGSMDEPNKLPLLIQSFKLMLGELRPEDRVAIVTYAGSAGLVLEPTEAKDRAKIEAALGQLMAGGSTAGAEGLELAYQTAESMEGEGRVKRILLATDGDFNVGVSDPEGLEAYVAKKRESGTYLSVLGFGRGNLDDAIMQSLAQNGNGTAAYIDTLTEAQKVLVDQLTGALFPIADDVKIQIEFNPNAIAEYRLIGYETRALAREDFNNDRVDAGEIGAGLQVTALYEVTPVGSPALRSDPLRYGTQADGEGDIAEIAFLKLRYKAPGEETSQLIEQPVPPTPTEPDADARFAAAIAGMGQLLSEPKYLGDWGWDEAITLATGAKGEDPYGYRAEAVQVMRLAESLSQP